MVRNTRSLKDEKKRRKKDREEKKSVILMLSRICTFCTVCLLCTTLCTVVVLMMRILLACATKAGGTSGGLLLLYVALQYSGRRPCPAAVTFLSLHHQGWLCSSDDAELQMLLLSCIYCITLDFDIFEMVFHCMCSK